VVGRAGFELATARYLWPRQARMKPTMGRPLQLLRPVASANGLESSARLSYLPTQNGFIKTMIMHLCVLALTPLIGSTKRFNSISHVKIVS